MCCILNVNDDDDDVMTTQHATPRSNVIASGGEDDLAYIWSAETGEVVNKLEGHDDSVIQIEFNRTYKYMSIISATNTSAGVSCESAHPRPPTLDGGLEVLPKQLSKGWCCCC